MEHLSIKITRVPNSFPGLAEDLDIESDGKTHYFRTGIEVKLPEQCGGLITPLLECWKKNVILLPFVLNQHEEHL